MTCNGNTIKFDPKIKSHRHPDSQKTFQIKNHSANNQATKGNQINDTEMKKKRWKELSLMREEERKYTKLKKKK